MKTTVKTLLISIVLLTIVQTAQAQAHLRRAFYGDFFAGMTLSTMDMKGENFYKKQRIGFMIGGNVNYKLIHNFKLQSGFYLIKKGLSQDEKSRTNSEAGHIDVVDLETTVDANYVQIPLNLGFEIPLVSAKNLYLNFHGGVYGAYGFKGNIKTRGYTAKEINGVLEDFNYSSVGDRKTFSSSTLKRWDYGLNANVALVYDIYILQFQYDHGLANVATSALGTEWNTRNYSISLGFRF